MSATRPTSPFTEGAPLAGEPVHTGDPQLDASLFVAADVGATVVLRPALAPPPA